MISPEEIEKRFGSTATNPEGTKNQHEELRALILEVVHFVNSRCSYERATSMALTELETASMWAHKALAQTLAPHRH